MAAAIQQYEILIQKHHTFNLPPYAFWTSNSVVDTNTGATLEYRDRKLGSQATQCIAGTSNEIGRLAQRVKPYMLTGSDTIHFIHPSQMSSDRRNTYLRIAAELMPNKSKNIVSSSM